jgi:glyoxylase-like metal-dependent hydrolase (beta-lactamase superfamily II)
VRVIVEVHEGIHRLSRGVCNFYLIEQSGKFTLVDAGAPGDWAFSGQALTSLGGKLADLDAVLLTHAHPDHVGIAERARTEAAARVWIHQADAQAARTGKAGGKADGKVRPTCSWPEFYRTLFSLARRGAVRMVPVKEVSGFGDGETIDVPGTPRVGACARGIRQAARQCCLRTAASC